MTLIQILWNYAHETYHYGRTKANRSLRELGIENKIMHLVQLSVDDDGNFLQDHKEDGDYTYIFLSWKSDLYRPHDSKRPTLESRKNGALH